MQVAIGFNFRRVLMIDDFVGFENVVAIVKDNVPGEGERIAGPDFLWPLWSPNELECPF